MLPYYAKKYYKLKVKMFECLLKTKVLEDFLSH